MKRFIRALLMGGVLGGLLLAQPAGTVTSLQITGCSSGCTVQFGHTVGFGATVVRSSNGAAVTSGSVTFYSGTSLLGVSGPPNASGVVPGISTRLLPAGVNAITARYQTNGSFSSSISSFIPVTVQSVAGNGFAPAATFPTGLGPYAVATGDFNNDGNPDFAVANTSSGTVTVFFGNGLGGFTSDPDGPFTVGTNPIAIAVGDFNGDGKLDIATANENSGSPTANISVLLNSGNLSATTATFSAAVNYSTGSGTASADAIAIGDFNGDGVPDLAVANHQVNGSVSILFGSTTSLGTFGAATIYSVGSLPDAIVVGDFDGDGVADVATANGAAGSNNVSVLFNQGSGTFPSIPTNLSTENGTSAPDSIVVADFNADGRPDLAVSNLGSSNVSVFLGSATGVFTLLSGGPFAVDGSPSGIVAGDFNGDGLMDIATVDNGASGASGVSVILGLAGGGFGTSSLYSTSSGSSTDKPNELVVADFNGDGIADIVTADPASGSGFHMSVLLGLVPTVTTLTSASPSPSTFGGSVTLAGSVGPGASAGDTVTFFAGSASVGTYTFSASATPGNFSFATSTIPQGVQFLTATYSGGAIYATSTTTSSLRLSNPANSTTTLLVSPNPSPSGQNVLLTATVTPGATGSVIFYNFGNSLGSAPLNQNNPNIATLQTSDLATVPGTNSITAQYQGDGNYQLSTSSPAVNEVILNATTTTLTSSANPSSQGQTTTLTANVTSGGSGAITGTISFYANGSVLLGSATLPANSIQYNFNSTGNEQLTAVYTPDSGSSGTFATSSSNPVSQNVLTSTNMALTSISPAAPVFGQVVTLKGLINPAPASPPYGKITFLDGATVLGTASVIANGTATFTTPLLGVGLRNLRARYETNSIAGLGSSTSTPSQVTVGSAAQSGFNPAVNYTAGANTFAVAVGDFNGDGVDDIATVTIGTSSPFFVGVQVFLGNGNGSFQSAQPYATQSAPTGITAADVDGDGHQDLLVSTGAGMQVFINSGSGGTFGAGSSPYSAIAGGSIVVADFNNDGIPDVVGLNNRAVIVLLGAGDGTFGTGATVLTTTNSAFLTTADFNNDGKADIAAADTGGFLYILMGNGDGTFQTPVLNSTEFRATTSSLFSIATGDFNGDGYPDIIMGGVPGSGTSTEVFLYPGSSGGFSSSALIPTSSEGFAVASGDFNGDGHTDIAVTEVSTGNIEILPGHGDFTFGAPLSYPIANPGYAIAVGNFSSGNGRADIAVAYGDTGDLGVVLSATAAGPTVTCASLNPSVYVGSAFSLSCPASGGVAPYTYAFGSGSTLAPASPAFAVDSTGFVTGTPTAAGPYTFTVQATDHSTPTPLVGVSSTVTLTVSPLITTTTTLSLSSGSNPTPLGQSVTLQAVVSPTPTGGGGVVVFYDGVNNGIGSSNVYSGVATFPTANLALGSHSITAIYFGDTTDAGSTATPLVVVVSAAAAPITFNYVSLVDGSSPLQALGYFRLEGLSGTSEVNGYTYSATAASLTSGAPIDVPVNNALQFNGSTSAVTTNLSGGIGNAGTIMAWVNMSVLPSTLNAIEYIAGESQGGNDFDLQFTSANVLGFYTTNGNQSISWAPPTGSLIGAWHQIVATFDNDDGSAVRALYWDGRQVVSDTVASIPNKTSNFQIGATSVFPGRNFDGLIDEVAVFNYALTPLQVTQIYYTPLSILPNGLSNQTYGPLTMSAAGGSGNYTWAATGLPTGLALSSSGVLSGSPSVSGAFSPVVITATDTSTSQTASLSYRLAVGPLTSNLSLSASPNPATPSTAVTLSANVTSAAPGTASPTGSVQFYDGETLLGTVALPGNGAPVTKTVTSFALGSHSLSAQYAGDTNFSFSFSSVFTETISNQPAPVTQPVTILTSSLPGGVVAQSYSAALSASGGTPPYSWSVNGSLPAGLSFSGGTISGIPAAVFSGNIGVIVTDSEGNQASVFLALQITQGPLSLSGNGNLGDIAIGTSTAASFTSGGGAPGPHTWSISGIPGLTVDANGNVRGTVANPGSYTGTLTVTDSAGGTASTGLTLAVLGLNGSFPSGTTTTTYTGAASGIGGVPPYSFTASGVPQGLNFSGGALSGNITTPGTYSLGVTVTDADGVSVTGTFTFKITGTAPKNLTITTTALPDGSVGQPYSQTLGAVGGNPGYTWAQSGGYLPPGLSLDSAGNISGTPSSATSTTLVGSYTIGVQVSDTSGAKVVGSVSLQIDPAPLQITSGASFPSGQQTVGYPTQILTTTGGAAPYTYSLSKGSLPSGMSLSNGQISGTPTATGNFSFTVTVADSSKPAQTASLTGSLQINPNTPDLVLSQASAGFTITEGTSSAPTADTISVASTVVGDILSYSVSSSVPWLTIGGSSSTPGFVTVGPNSASLALSTAGSPYLGTVTVTCTSQQCSGKSQTITVVLNITSPPPQITLGTPLLSFATVLANPQATAQSLAIVNAGGGTLTINSVTAADSWITVGSFPAGVAPGPGGSVTITADPTGLKPGYYSSSVTVNSSAGNASVPVGLLIATAGSMTLGPAGTQFSMSQGGAVGNPNASFLVSVSSGALNYTVTILPGASWLSGGGTGSAGASSPGSVNLTVNQGVAATLAPGAYYATVRVSGTDVINAPQDYQAVLNVGPANSVVTPNPSPAGLVFLAPSNGAAPAPQAISLYASSLAKVAFQTAITMNNGGGWLSVSPVAGATSASSPAQLLVTTRPSGLKSGVYTGEVSFAFGSTVSSVNVTLVVEQPVGGTAGALSSLSRTGNPIDPSPEASTSCAGGQLVPTQTGLVTNFSAPASWPTPLAIILVDTCGNPIGSGQVVTTFSNGDPPLILSPIDPQHGLYSGTWTPRKTSQQVSILARATSPGYPAATTQIAGQVAPNTAPVLAPNGTLDIFTPVVGAGLGPGNIVQIYGSGLASQIAAPSTLPLPISLNGTQVLIGGVNAPLFYVSSGQVNAQIPFSLNGGQQYQVIVSANGALTTPQPINLTPAVPSILLYNSGIVVAQHPDGTDVTAAAPAAPGEVVSFYLSGLGATDQDVSSGDPSPSNPPANVLTRPTLTFNNAPAQVLFAGLAPGFVGLYQINFQVPSPLTDGNYTLFITQGNVSSNTGVIPVQNPEQN